MNSCYDNKPQTCVTDYAIILSLPITGMKLYEAQCNFIMFEGINVKGREEQRK